jgi:hypothetical protein
MSANWRGCPDGSHSVLLDTPFGLLRGAFIADMASPQPLS